MRHDVRLTINAPADLVWRTMSGVEDWPRWTPTVTSASSSGSGELAVGDAVTVRQPGQRDRVWTVTELVPGESFVWEAADPGGVRLRAGHRAVPGDDGATTVELTFAVAGPLGWLVGALAGRTIRTAVATEAASLKTWCERRA